MSQIINGLSEVADRYQAIFSDVWGVVHNGERAHLDAVAALMEFRAQGKFVALVTNAPKTPSAIAAQLRGLGIPDRAYDVIVTAGEAMQYSLFGTKFARAHFIGASRDRVILTDPPEGVNVGMTESDINNAEVVICAGLEYGMRDEVADYEIELRQAANLKLPMYCANPDIVVDRGETRIYCAGALSEFYETLGGEVFQFGKPHPPIYRLAMRRVQEKLQLKPDELDTGDILFIGDGITTDILGAMQEDLDALFVSGGLAFEDTGTRREDTAPTPDADMLSNYLRDNNASPLLSIGTLRW